MKAHKSGPILSTIFVDYDNIYLSLKRKNEEAAKRFAKEASSWLREIASGRLITPTGAFIADVDRRLVMTRVYGNPVPRRNTSDNSTDMNSFPFVRHHFLRAGFEVIDCPPLTAQLKNSSDIRMVMDVRDLLAHDTYFDEFIILSGDADFTPLLHRLRAHARRTVIFANDHTAQPYVAISDGEVREASLITMLVDGQTDAEPQRLEAAAPAPLVTQAPSMAQAQVAEPVQVREQQTAPTLQAPVAPAAALPTVQQLDAARREIVAEVVATVKAAGQPLPLEVLADRAIRVLGHDRTIGTAWGGAGNFRELIQRALPEPFRVSTEQPYLVYEVPARQAQPPVQQQAPAPLVAQSPLQTRLAAPPAAETFETRFSRPPVFTEPEPQSQMPPPSAPRMPVFQQPAAELPQAPVARAPAPIQTAPQNVPAQKTRPSGPAEGATAIQQSISRIHEACQAPPLSPPEYRALFEVMAQEINANGLTGSQTLTNIVARAAELGVEVRKDDVRFVLEVVSEADPWFEQGASTSLFSGRFRNFVVARCRGQGLNLSADELDLIEAWFASGPAERRGQQPAAAQRQSAAAAPAPAAGEPARSSDRWWNLDEGRQHVAAGRGQGGFETSPSSEEMPRFVRTRQRG